MTLSTTIARIMSEVVRDQGYGVDKPLPDELYRFIDAVQVKAGKVVEEKPEWAPVDDCPH